ncbi:MAG TPA: D-Ala-D-Ala carboxypeptidase family metallohydrolase [Actinomycetota bacterium]|nr:D-Ala-D-Ala carboxypeptidase family metallohydrolase [Actinomycetota bacterium]
MARSREAALSLLVGGALVLSAAAPGAAEAAPRALRPGDSGPAVRRLQVRVAGWYPKSNRRVHFPLDGVYGRQTRAAVAAFQSRYGIAADGVAGRATMRVIARLTDDNGSTAHFDWSEFTQNRNPACSAQANAYAGTFGGGRVAARRAKRNVRRLMWRLEAVRARGRRPVGVNSGFRSVPYNDCIGGARASQHLFGTAADNRMAAVSNHRERRFARRSQFHGIGCYASLAHNHFDVRLDNRDLPGSRFWWWPERDRKGRDLDESGKPCWGERKRRSGGRADPAAVRAAVGGAGSLVPSVVEVRAFAAAGEPDRLGAPD